MRSVFIGLCCLVLSGVAVAKTPPNIVVILSDDQGYADVSFNPHSPPEVSTPNIDKLAKSGVVCTDGYASGYVCSPTRAGLMTGRYQQRFGIYTAGQGGSGMPLDETWMPMHLKPAGYTCGAFGKWHLGLTMDYHPNNRGFDYSFVFMGRGAHDYFDHSPEPQGNLHPVYRNLDILEDLEGYMTTLITQEAVDFIKREKDKPFFAYVAYNAVHTPAQAPEEDIKRYNTGDETRDILMAMLYHLDLGVGEIVQALKDARVYDNTIIFYLSDNGGASAMHANNAPLRGMKQHIYEGGTRVPFIVSWPGKLKAGSRCNVPVWSTDILPTSLALSGIDPLPGSKPLDGKDIMPALKGKVDRIHDALYWCSGEDGKWSVRQGDWKYLFDKGNVGLYNLADDLAEENNLKDAHPEKFQALEKLYNDWFEQMGDPAKGSKHYGKNDSGKKDKAKKSSKDAADPKPAAKPKKEGDLGYGFKKDGIPRQLPPVTGTPEEKKAKREKMRAEKKAGKKGKIESGEAETKSIKKSAPIAEVNRGAAQNRAQNPIVTHMYTADPTARVWDDGRLYVYPSTDTYPAIGCSLMDGYHVFSTDDMVTFTDHGEILHSRDVEWGREEGGFMWAPDCMYRNGTYYYYFPHPSATDRKTSWKTGIAVSKKPASDFELKGYIEGLDPLIDPNVFIDDDGQAYFYHGGG